MRINRTLCGKGGGGGQTTVTENKIPEEFVPYLFGNGGIITDAQSMFNQGGFGVPDRPGSTTQEAWQTGKNLASNLTSSFLPDMQTLLKNMQTPGSARGAELDAAMKAATTPLTDQYSRVTIPSIQDSAIMSGTTGSARQGIAEGLAKSDLDRSVLDVNSKMQYQALSDDLSRTQQGQALASQFAPSLLNMLSTPTNILSGIGSQQDAFQSLLNNAGKNNLTDYADLIRSFIPGTSSSSTATGPKGSKWGGALSGAGTGALIGSQIMPGIGTGIGAGLGALGGLFG
jgi:hypothetical protein